MKCQKHTFNKNYFIIKYMVSARVHVIKLQKRKVEGKVETKGLRSTHLYEIHFESNR